MEGQIQAGSSQSCERWMIWKMAQSGLRHLRRPTMLLSRRRRKLHKLQQHKRKRKMMMRTMTMTIGTHTTRPQLLEHLRNDRLHQCRPQSWA